MLGMINTVLGDVGGKVVSLLKVDSGILLGLLGGLVVVALLLLAYRGILKLRDKSQGVPFLEKIKGAMARTPAAVADPAKRARLDDLRKKYEEGVEKFRQAGKDLYSLPWYLLVGPAGSGKTEAMRHCKVGFPPGLQDCFQGAGGTMNMHWWFTNHAVVLDTAGRMFMEESALQGGSEWREFLKLLKQSRPNAPVNGMLLVIGVDSLIKDTSEQIESQAGHIAKQLDTIQRTLDVRFPVYVVLTKCDLITGFKEFFDKIDDPQLQHQILGWSNPAPLDEAFRAEAVDDHIRTIRTRLLKRRATLLMDPVHTEDPQARRTDQVDELFALPDNITKIAPRLRRYLEIIFQAGEWSPKPLFLRGMYFTSSMRQGKALDEDLAAALGVGVDAIPGGKVYDEERPYFLRDVFTAKIFREKGLVTRATNVQREQTGRKRLLLGSGVVVAAALLGATFFSSAQLRQAVKDPLDTWKQIAGNLNQAAVVNLGASGADAYFGNEARVEVAGGEKITPLALLERAREQSESPVSMGFLSFGRVLSDVNENQRRAYQAVVQRAVAEPIIGRTRAQLTDRGVPWSPRATAALAELVAAETRARGATPALDSDAKDADAKPDTKTDGRTDPKASFPAGMLAFLIPGGETTAIPAADVEKLRVAIKAIAPESYAEIGLAGTDASLDDIRKAIDRARDSWEKSGATTGDLGALAAADEALTAYTAAAAQARQLVERQPTTIEQYNAFASQYAKSVTDLERAAIDGKLADAAGVWARLGERSEQELAESARREIRRQTDLVASGLPKDVKAEVEKRSKAGPAAETISVGLTQAFEASTKDLPAKAAAVKNSLKADAKRALLERGRSADEPGFQSVIALLKTATPVVAPADATPAAWLTTADRVKDVSDAAATARKLLVDWENAAPPTLRSLNFGTVASRAVEIGRGGRVGAWLASFAAGLEGGGKSIREVVAGVAGAPPAKRTIAMSALDGKQDIDAGFSPAVASSVFQGWKAVRTETRGDLKSWIVLEPAPADQISKLAPAVSLYGREYADAWQTKLGQSKVREFRTWTEFFKAYEETESPDPAEIHAALKELHEQVRRDLLAIADGLDSQEIRDRATTVERQLAVLNAASGEAVREKINAARAKLKLLGPDVRRARAQVLELMATGNLDIETLTGAFSDSVPEYWQSLVQRGMEALSAEYQASAQADLDRLRGLARFPLVSDFSTQPLTAEEFAVAVRALDDLQASASERAVQPPPRPTSLREPLQGLIRARTLRERPALAEFVQKAKRVADALAGEDGQSLVLSIARVNESRKPAASGEYEAMRWVADQWIWKGVMGQGESTDAADSDPIRAPRAGEQTLSLVFMNRAQGGVEVGKVEFPAPWAGPRLVLTPGAEPDRAAGDAKGPATVWLVPITVPVEADVQGSKRMINRFMWVKVTLKRGLPVGKEWPSKDDLDR